MNDDFVPKLGPVLVVLGLTIACAVLYRLWSRRDPYGSYRPEGLRWYQGQPWDEWGLRWFLSGFLLLPVLMLGNVPSLQPFAVAAVWVWGVPWSLMLFGTMAYLTWIILASLLRWTAARWGKKE